MLIADNITHCLRHRDPDVALKLADEQVQDWKGGTRTVSYTHLDVYKRQRSTSSNEGWSWSTSRLA